MAVGLKHDHPFTHMHTHSQNNQALIYFLCNDLFMNHNGHKLKSLRRTKKFKTHTDTLALSVLNFFCLSWTFKTDMAKVSVCLSLSMQAILLKLLKSSSSNLAQWLPRTWECITVLILCVTFIHAIMVTHFSCENNKCLTMSETVQAMPIKFAVKLVWLRVYIFFSQSDDLNLHSRLQWHLKLDKCFTCNMIVIHSCQP